MTDIKEIRQRLWNSLDMQSVVIWFFAGVVLAVAVTLMVLLRPMYVTGPEKTVILIIMLAVCAGPLFGFCIWRTFRIFRHPESYTFCRSVLSNPKGGSIRDTIRFTVVIEDGDGNKFAADTHSIFTTHRGFLAAALEDYVNRTVTIAYNEETGMVVVIG